MSRWSQGRQESIMLVLTCRVIVQLAGLMSSYRAVQQMAAQPSPSTLLHHPAEQEVGLSQSPRCHRMTRTLQAGNRSISSRRTSRQYGVNGHVS